MKIYDIFFASTEGKLVTSVDNDNDDLPDTWEIFYFDGLSQQDGEGDADNDGLTNTEEFEIRTDPTFADRDGDGIEDLLDNCPTTSNPDQQDSDEDGIGDACEPVLGDLDGDRNVDDTDRSIIMGALRACRGSAKYVAAADYDGDGCVTLNDYRQWYKYYQAFISS
jgi:hypothetical protein